ELEASLIGVKNAMGNAFIGDLTRLNVQLAEFVDKHQGEIKFGIEKAIRDLGDAVSKEAPEVYKNLSLLKDFIGEVRKLQNVGQLGQIDWGHFLAFGQFDARFEAFMASWRRRWAEFKNTFTFENYGKFGENLTTTP